MCKDLNNCNISMTHQGFRLGTACSSLRLPSGSLAIKHFASFARVSGSFLYCQLLSFRDSYSSFVHSQRATAGCTSTIK